MPSTPKVGRSSESKGGILLTVAKGAPTASFRFVQANLQRKKLATIELMLEAQKRGVAAALLQEPFVGKHKEMGVYRGVRVIHCTSPNGGTVKAAIAVFNQDVKSCQVDR